MSPETLGQFIWLEVCNATDFDYEANMDYFNKGLAPELETVYLIKRSHEVDTSFFESCA